MLRILERNIASVAERLVLLAPAQAKIPRDFLNITVDFASRAGLLREMQRVRGSIYLSEGNIRPDQLTADGRHQSPEDDRSWHLLMTDGSGKVTACAWYLEHGNKASIEDLRVKNCPLAKLDDWSDLLRNAVDVEIARARRDNFGFGEFGGWAVSKERRGTPECLMLALASYALCRSLGGALAITTANVKHGSASILRRLGGSFLESGGKTVPGYFDSRYNADIELLRFDSRTPSPKYVGLIDMLSHRLSNVPVFSGVAQSHTMAPYWVPTKRAAGVALAT